jgi:hypothetical protein
MSSIYINLFQISHLMFSENLATRGTAKQSSTYGSSHASKAVDGNINQNWEEGSCSHTAIRQTEAWWRLDIGQRANIYNIVIYGNCRKYYFVLQFHA